MQNNLLQLGLAHFTAFRAYLQHNWQTKLYSVRVTTSTGVSSEAYDSTGSGSDISLCRLGGEVGE